MIDIANQIGNLLIKYLPYTAAASMGYQFPVSDVAIDGDKVTLTLSSEDYAAVQSRMTDNNNSSFTVNGFYTRCNITSFTTYNAGVGDSFAFEATFDRAPGFKINEEITLKGFTDAQYNIPYKAIRKLSSNKFILYASEDVDIENVTVGLGYVPIQYTEGFNDVVSLTDEGSNQFSFIVDADSYYYVDSVDKLDLLDQVKIFDYLNTVKVIDAKVFQENLESADGNTSYLIVDSSSLSGSPARRSSQKFDSDYFLMNRNGAFEKNFIINVKYLLQRVTDEEGEQTSSGSDIAAKQMDMHKALTSILRSPLDGDDTTRFSAITIQRDFVEDRVSGGRVVISYELGLVACYRDDIMIKTNIKSYPIEKLKINKDLLVF